MPPVVRSILIGSAAGVPLAVALVIVANTADLSRGVILALYLVAVAIPVLVGVHLEDKRRHPPPARTQHR
jgi:hypothetical protein